MAEAAKNPQPTAVIAKIYGSDVRRIQQLNAQGVIHGEGRPAMYDLIPTIQALFAYQRQLIQGQRGNPEAEKQESAKRAADIRIKNARAKMAEMEQQQLAGSLLLASDVEAITTDHVLFFRSILLGLPGKLAVDLAGDHTAAEQAQVVQREVNSILDALANYKFDPAEYERRLKERRGWDGTADPGDADA